jgi:hypothetical protein
MYGAHVQKISFRNNEANVAGHLFPTAVSLFAQLFAADASRIRVSRRARDFANLSGIGNWSGKLFERFKYSTMADAWLKVFRQAATKNQRRSFR